MAIMEPTEYKGFMITPLPKFQKSGRWSTNFHISTVGKMDEQRFSDELEHANENDAALYCIELGKKIIDEKF